jgi:hypothetical protein
LEDQLFLMVKQLSEIFGISFNVLPWILGEYFVLLLLTSLTVYYYEKLFDSSCCFGQSDCESIAVRVEY